LCSASKIRTLFYTAFPAVPLTKTCPSNKPNAAPYHRTSRGDKAFEASEGRALGGIVAAFAPHPTLRATFATRSGEKEHLNHAHR
jgi:hypothetical protein